MQPDGILYALLFRHTWLLFILVTCLNGASWWRESRSRIRADRALASGYTRLLRGWLVFGNLPWIVMGIGILTADLPTSFHYLNPRNGPVVLVWYATVVAEWVALLYWTFLRHGAETLAAHPGLLNWPREPRPWHFKVYILLLIAGGVAGLLGSLRADFPPLDWPPG
jgi:hypothetical protein